MRTNVRFRTTLFSPQPVSGEPFSGISLAEWLFDNFSDSFQLDYLDGDFSCALFLGNPVEKKLIGACGHVENDLWQVFMKVKPSFSDKLLNRKVNIAIHEEFILALDNELKENQDIFDIEWYEENSRMKELNHAETAFD